MTRPRDPKLDPAERFVIDFDHALASATIAHKLFTAQRAMRVKKVEYVNPTGYSDDAANFYDIEVLKGATVVASWSTDTAAEGAIAADTFVNPTLSATDQNLVIDVDDEVSLSLTKNAAAANLPAGRIVLHGEYV